MYTEFYNLKEKPFNLTPSPRYLYLGEIHKEALALLTYGVVERKGFILLTGEVGTGKTTIVQALLANLDQNVHYVYLSNPILSASDFMDYLAFSAFKKKVHFKSKSEFLIEFERFLKECLQHQENFILLIDEAHKLSEGLLEEIRLLSNMETADEKLVNIFLVGQPELNQKLNQPQCRALLQRISVRYHIRPLTLGETGEYIDNRLKIAGTRNGHRIFPGSTIKSVYEFSEGFPRVINILCDNALLLGYSREKGTITPGMIRECYEDLKLEEGPSKTFNEKNADDRKDSNARSSWRGHVKWFLLLMLAFVVGMAITGKGPLVYRSLFRSGIAAKSSGHVNPSTVTTTHRFQVKNLQKSERKLDEGNGAGNGVSGGAPIQTGVRQVPEGNTKTVPKTEAEMAKASITPAKVVVVKAGDTVTELATAVYGFVNDDILKLIKESNPELANINMISVGQSIVFPPLKTGKETPTYTIQIASFAPIGDARKLFRKLLEEGYEAYILPFHDPEKGKVFRVTIGNFKGLDSAKAYAETILEKGLAKEATPTQVELK